ncbi:concanavalin A-like lectin/glucanase domain-containing protein [Jimgerdemannia flammicorona]|uniref:Concanavalin A-like lectin/glucanase domain-containing protein n=1 Tax=Jimgerdemannia flammicorona TaxID=994334 RepID=A0A433Q921_9FUNG|nr:concanavalin A-like lectin/glucanase domain-containing protein [Jimgerdemannia flammicorona]
MAGRILSEAAEILDQCPSDEALYSVVRDFILARPLNYGQLYSLSKDAMAVLLSDADAVRECPMYAFDFFLCIIDWACEMISDAHLGIKRSDLLAALSSLEATESMLQNPPDAQLSADTLKRLESVLTPIVRCINFQDICPHRLVTLMDTLSFIPPSIFAAALRRHITARTVCPPSWRHRTGCLWDPGHMGPLLRLLDNHAVVEFDETQPNRHQSVTSAAAMKDKGVYEWDVIIQAFNSAHSRVAVGLAAKSISSHENALLGKQSNSWGLASTGKVYCPYSETVYVGGFGKDSVISFRVDMAERCCSIAVNGVDKGVIWKNLPDNIYPACSLTLGSRCEIRQRS